MSVFLEPDPALLYLYRQHGCELCDEAEVELQAAELPYVAFYVTAAPEPDQAIVWNPDGTQERAPRASFVGFPMLADLQLGLRFVGLPAIRQRVQLRQG